MRQPTEFDAVLGGFSPPTTSAVLGMTSRYSYPEYKQFCRDMAAVGLRVEHARMRFYWEGPVVYTNDLQDVLSYTKVKCIWDENASGFIVYPRAYSALSLLEAMDNFEQDKILLSMRLKMSQPHKGIVENFLAQIQQFRPSIIQE